MCVIECAMALVSFMACVFARKEPMICTSYSLRQCFSVRSNCEAMNGKIVG